MIPPSWFIIGALLLVNAIGGAGGLWAATVRWDQADVILTDETRGAYGPLSASGDFNGDGQKDLVFVADEKAMVILGEPLPSRGNVGTLVDWTIQLTNSVFGYAPASAISMADLNDDGRDDIAIGFPQIDYNANGKVLVFFGRPETGGTIDLTQTLAGVEINGKNSSYLGKSLDMGDFNGDGIKDLLMGCFANGFPEAYILWGSSSLSPNIINLAGGGVLTTMSFAGSGQTEFVTAGDVNGDGKSEALISANASGGGFRTIYVVWGSTPFVTTPQVQFQSSVLSSDRLISPFVGNFDGDSRGDVALWNWIPSPPGYIGLGPVSVLLGAWISSGTVIGLNSSAPNYIPPVSFGTYREPLVQGDFDGDGRTDVVGVEPVGSSKSPLRGFLSSAHSGGWTQGDSFTSNFQVDLFDAGYLDTRLAMGDINGDGRQDLLVARILNASPSQFLIFYGFIPLLNPRVEVVENDGGARVVVSLSANGDPSEMRLGGHIIDDFRDQWIPFKSKHAVTLTPEPGTKTVTALFRNSLKRESALAQTMVVLAPIRTGVEVISNRVRANGRAVVECPMETAGRLRATLWTSDGNRVRDLVDEERGAGVWTLEWDGRNAEGKRVAPGVYILQLDINGHVERTKILVQG